MATQEVRNQEKQPDAFAESSESFCVDFGLTTEITAHKAVLKKNIAHLLTLLRTLIVWFTNVVVGWGGGR